MQDGSTYLRAEVVDFDDTEEMERKEDENGEQEDEWKEAPKMKIVGRCVCFASSLVCLVLLGYYFKMVVKARQL